MDITLKHAPSDPAMRARIAELARILADAEALAGPSFVLSQSGAQRQTPGSERPKGNPAGLVLCKHLEEWLGDEVRTARRRVRETKAAIEAGTAR